MGLRNTLTRIVLAGALTCGSFACNKEVKSLDSFLVTDSAKVIFQEDLPGAKKIEEYHMPGSEEILIFIRQYHHLPWGIGHPAERYKINKVQENIFEILEELYLNGNIKAFYVEGVTIEGENKINELAHKNKGNNYSLMLLNATAPLELQMYGAASVMAIKHGLKLVAAENKELNEIASELVFLSPNHVLKDREDFLLDKIDDDDDLQGEDYTVFVYGAGHDFKDNVAEWNANHPDNKYSLVIITPKGIKEIK